MDLFFTLRFWAAIFLVGAAAFPLTRRLFSKWWDGGYLFAKAVGMLLVTYLVWLGASLHLMPFTLSAIIVAVIGVFLIGITTSRWFGQKRQSVPFLSWQMVAFEEIFFLVALLFWAWVKAHEPSIHGLEKFMDFGFTKSILDSTFFPPVDMWYAGKPINYYYFGHVVMAMLTRLSGVDLSVTFNLMLSALFALTATMSFSLGVQVFRMVVAERHDRLRLAVGPASFIAGGLVAFLTSLAGNMQTIYAFTRGYTGDDAQPFWQLFWGAGEFFRKLPEGINTYWYANATRFIPFTIHEFPGYSFVVSDVHGHVLSLPFALLAIGFLVALFGLYRQGSGESRRMYYARYVFFGLLIAVLFMTNALDGPIYAGLLTVFLFFEASPYTSWSVGWLQEKGYRFLAVVTTAAVAVIPFLMHFSSFVSGVAVNCPPASMANSRIGPILFEEATKCQHSPFWMMWLLWGFFWFCGLWMLHNKFSLKDKFPYVNIKVTHTERILAFFFVYCLGLLIFPEFFYFKDIYPAHFRSNTMFKLGYQAFLILSLLSGVVIVREVLGLGSLKDRFRSARRGIFLVLILPQLFLVSIYPWFSIRSYFNRLSVYEGLNGVRWLALTYPNDFAAITFLNRELAAGGLISYHGIRPVIVEADGDSYTDYARVSAFTGIPTIIGWPVHEWLWRGTYDVVAPRREIVRRIYTESDPEVTRKLLAEYNVGYVFVGTLEREKYPDLNEQKFSQIGTMVFESGQTRIYRVM